MTDQQASGLRLLSLVTLGMALVAFVAAVGYVLWPHDAKGPPEAAAPSARQGDSALPHPGTSNPSGAGAKADTNQPNVVKLIGNAPSCKRRPQGTGFAYQPERVMTTAHLVSGTTGSITVVEPDSKHHTGKVVLYDPGRDLAVLHVPGLAARSLALGPIEPGNNASIVGYPNDGVLTVTPARVERSKTMQGPDIYQKRQTKREVLVIQGGIKPGVAGGPLFRTDGIVSGMVFAADLTQPDRSYALTAAEITRPWLDGMTTTKTVSTQGCTE